MVSNQPPSGGMKLAGCVRPRSEWDKMRAAERRHSYDTDTGRHGIT